MQVVNPMYAVISAGRDNAYGHPHQETLKRLGACGTRIFQTSEAGAITLRVKKNVLSIKGFLTR